MIASAIAYFLSIFFFASGVLGFWDVGRKKYTGNDARHHLIGSLIWCFAAWGAAYMGGI